MLPDPVVIGPGESAQVAVTLGRINYGSALGLVLDAPSGVTGVFAPQRTAGNASVLTLSVDAGMALGSYQLTVRATARGLPDRVRTFRLVVAGS